MFEPQFQRSQDVIRVDLCGEIIPAQLSEMKPDFEMDLHPSLTHYVCVCVFLLIHICLVSFV